MIQHTRLHYQQLSDLSSLQTTMEEIVLCDNCCKDSSLTTIEWHDMKNLRVIDIGNGCFEFVTSFSLYNLPKLQSFVMGWECCFHMDHTGEFHLHDCQELRQIQIGLWSFYEYTQFDLRSIRIIMINKNRC